MNNLSDRRNRTGVAYLRSRLIARARTLAKDKSFRDAIDAFRGYWNHNAPRYSTTIVPTVEDLLTSPLISKTAIAFAPRRWIDDTIAGRALNTNGLNWYSEVGSLCKDFYPFEDFGDGRFDDDESAWSHPAMQFVSACVFCPVAVVVDAVETLIPTPAIQASSLPFPPDPLDQLMIARLRGEVRFWRYMALAPFMESTDEDELKTLVEAADHAGWDYANQQGALPGIRAADADRWWYLPLTPFTTSKDIKDAAPGIAETMRAVHGARPIDERIRKKLAMGKTQAQIAAELGIDTGMVRAVQRDQESEG